MAGFRSPVTPAFWTATAKRWRCGAFLYRRPACLGHVFGRLLCTVQTERTHPETLLRNAARNIFLTAAMASWISCSANKWSRMLANVCSRNESGKRTNSRLSLSLPQYQGRRHFDDRAGPRHRQPGQHDHDQQCDRNGYSLHCHGRLGAYADACDPTHTAQFLRPSGITPRSRICHA